MRTTPGRVPAPVSTTFAGLLTRLRYNDTGTVLADHGCYGCETPATPSTSC